MATLAVYNPEEVVVVIAGLITLDGFPDGTFIEIKRDIPHIRSVRTSDGQHARMYQRDQSYSISITLLSGSGSNDVLTKLWQLEEITQRGKFPLFIKDYSGSDLFFSTTTWIEELPPIVKSTTYEERTWVLKGIQDVINIGGNEKASGILNDLVNVAISGLPILEGIF